jgi:16S rRNA (cytidine1402-2'-O)-methyltransferase
MEVQAGTLYLVATPIGNLGDMTPRGVETLKNVGNVFAEDTRTFAALARHFGIKTRYRSLHDHNERAMADVVVEMLQNGESAALVSEAGTPGISDPGYRVVSACRENGIRVESIPGACAAITALAISGFETDRFLFAGFLPLKPGKRKRELEELLKTTCAVILYESPHRVVKTLHTIAELAPDRQVFIGRELTKLHEEHIRGFATEVHAEAAAKPPRGEYVIVIRRFESGPGEAD